MGRSKFPGKPSKSINRKRISVLQLDDEAATTKPAEDGVTAAATTNNDNKGNCDDDEDNEKGGGGGGGGAATGGGAGGGNVAGNGSTSDTSTSGGTQNKNVNGNSGSNSDTNGGAKTEEAIGNEDEHSAKICPDAPPNIAHQQHDIELDDDIDADADDDDDEDEEDSDEEDSDSLQATTCASFSAVGKRKPNKKFKNLNLAKPEVMLPSSSKLKQQEQQQQLNCPDSPTTSLTVSQNPFAVEGKLLTGDSSNGSSTGDVLNSLEAATKSHKKSDMPSNKPSDDIASSCSTANDSSAANADTSQNSASTSAGNTSPGDKASAKQKKTVTFKNILETSDDKCAVKKFYNPDNRIPLVSIMKKECLNRHMMYSRSSECIVRPSRLTEILKNNSNIDKTNALKFRSANAATATAACGPVASAFGGELSRAFGAPADGEDHKHATVTFCVKNDSTTAASAAVATNSAVEGQAKNAIATPKRPTVEVEPEDMDDDDEQQMIVDKHFVLPKRSTRSSRVIKPNKRLVEDGIICKKSAAKAKQTPVPAAANAAEPAAAAAVVNAPKKDQQNYFGLGDYAATDNCDSKLKLGLTTTTAKEPTDAKSPFSLTPNFPNFGGIKAPNFVLRQPRLQFDSLSTNSTLPAAATATAATTSQSPSGLLFKELSPGLSATPLLGVATSPFLLANANTAMNSPSLLNMQSTCGVCTTVIHSKNMQDARKYGVLACEPCRKFISKITKKSVAANASPSLKAMQLQCKGDGNCHIQPHIKGHIKNFKKVYKERCSACWLKKCLQTFQFPLGHKLRLSAALPTITLTENESSMKKDLDASLSPTGLFSAPRLSWKPTLETTNESLKLNLKSNPLADNVTFGSSPLLRPAILEKPLFLKSIAEQPQTGEKVEETEAEPCDKKADKDKAAPADKVEKEKLSKSKRKDKEKDKPKEKEKDKPKEKEKDKLKEKEKDKPNKEKERELSPKSKHTKPVESIKPSAALPAIDVGDNNKATAPAATVANDPAAAVHALTVDVTATSAPTSNALSTPSSTAPITSPSTAGSTNADGPKRQRIDLKGPRVKHVCRSASIVLGQPLAMFGEEEVEGGVEETITAPENALEAEQPQQLEEPQAMSNERKTPTSPSTKASALLVDENDNCSSCKEDQQQQKQQQEQQQLQPKGQEEQAQPPTTCLAPPAKLENTDLNEPAAKASKISERKPSSVMPATKVATRNGNQVQAPRASTVPSYATAISKKYMRQLNNDPQQQRRKEAVKSKPLISIDFWENYDPAEVCQTGFGLIVTETVAQSALCFLCGSSGLDPLIFCACCCEPYHQYCVMDEYNLKHSSLDDTMASLMDISLANTADNFNHITNRLNWLCPRCTVCYTCNMSSGTKVRCQKCQKNYHATCLGTSKRLLGADRPLICVSCLKCKSCSTTKVSKFVGNLPMCTSCFKLRKKGNYCPICQKCYDDNDFDLKMMECGDCKQWVHSKCEGLSDEQYNLLSTLPETIEFICKKCARRSEHSKFRSQEWRLAVMEEFKTSLMSVLKLLSKSRQACALLKLSPRKKVQCTCETQGNGKIYPKALQFNGEGDSSPEDVYTFKEQSQDEKSPKEKCACTQPMATHAFYGAACNNSLSLVDIKKKICSNKYSSLAEFNYDMSNVIQSANYDELVIAYKEILSEQFPWFQNETKACTDALEEDMFESCSYAINMDMESAENYGAEEEDSNRPVLDLPNDIDEVIYSLRPRQDNRTCLFCRKSGEGLPNEEARLLYCGHDCWVHTNCAMWSAEVFEEIDGSLQNVHSAVSRGRMIKCTVCGNRGATVGCNVKSCGEHYHYPCARSIACAFLTDKTLYCPEHAAHALKGKSNVTVETNFEVARPVYVELDRKRKKLIEPAKVQFHIGSLEVKQLGSVFPRFSDSYEAIVPIHFLCTRLYWSIKEPWKIVAYTVRTTIQNSFSTLTSLDAGRNFTVDHSNPNQSLVQLGLTQISRWHSSLARGELMDLVEPTLTKLLPEYLFYNQNSSSANDENTEEEPQTNADLLPPEIKDAIFEDLPHELLDGISMLDIFPKFMIYEELGNGVDAKSEFFGNEQSKDNATNSSSNVQISDEDTATSTSLTKQLELSSNSWPSNNLSLSQVEDVLRSAHKSELLKKAAPSPQQRAWAKLDGSQVVAAAAIKRRKLSKGLPEGVILSLSQQRAKKESAAATAVSRRQSQNSEKAFTWSAAKRYIDTQEDSLIKLMQVDGVDDSITEYRIINADGQFNGTVKCERCHCTYRTYDSFQRHLATCEPLSSTSESESDAASRTSESTSPVITLEQINELNKRAANMSNSSGGMPFVQAFSAQGIPLGNIQANINGIPIANMQGLQNIQNIQGLQNLQGLQNIQLQNLQPQATQLGGNFFISAAQPTTSTTDDLQYFANSLQGLTANLNGTYTLAPTNGFGTATVQAQQQQPQLIALSTNADGTQQIIQLPSQNNQQLLQATNIGTTFQSMQAPNVGQKNGGKQLKSLGNKVTTQASAALKQKQLRAGGGGNGMKPIQSKLMTPNSTQQQTPITVVNNSQAATQLLNQNLLQQIQQQQQQQQQQPQLLFQTNGANVGGQQQPIITMQQLGAANGSVPQNIISFVTTDAGQNPQVQYVSIPSTNDYKQQTQASPFITATTNTNPLMQGAFLQTDASGNLMLTTAPQMMQSQPQVIGTLIQPQTLQLGGNVIATTADPQQQQQVIIGGGSTGLEMISAGNSGQPQVILATQPMYYGLETIVQNTVMSSQQFVSTAMQGVLSQNASFSATTTQVFQASKIEPIVDLPTGYVVLNNVDGTTSLVQQSANPQTNFLMQQQQQQQQQSQQTTQNQHVAEPPTNQLEQQQQIYRIQTTNADNTTTTTSYHYQTAPQQPQQFVDTTPTVQIVTAKVPPVAQAKRHNGTTKVTPAVTKVQPHVVVNKVTPTTIAQQKVNNKCPPQHTYQRNSTPTTVVVKEQQQLNNGQAKATLHYNGNNAKHDQQKPMQSHPVQRKTNLIRPIHKVEVKPKVIKTATTKQAVSAALATAKMAMLKPQAQPPQQQLQLQQPQYQEHAANTVKLIECEAMVSPQQLAAPEQQQHFGIIVTNAEQTSATIEQALNSGYIYSSTAEDDYQDELQYSSTSELSSPEHDGYEQQEDVLNVLPSNNRLQYGHVPTNIVNPMQQYSAGNGTAQLSNPPFVCRPTNRVLPMQQRQDQNVSPLGGADCKATTTKTASNQLKCNKLAYEAEVKRDEEELLNELTSPQHQIMAAHASPSSNDYDKSISAAEEYIEDERALKCDLEAMETDEALTCQQIQLVANDLQNYAVNGCFMDEEKLKEAREQQQDYDGLDVAEDEELGEEEDDDDDDFSLKMPTDDGDHDMSDGDEPEVKEKISKILDNLTNEDCADSIATATTVEATGDLTGMRYVREQLSHVLPTQVESAQKYEYATTAEENDAVAAAATEYISQMTEQLSNEIENPELIDTNFELKKFKPKLAADIEIPLATVPNNSDAEQLLQHSETMNINKPTLSPPPMPPPMRDPKKIAGPHLLYEIQSEDGFTYKSTSITEVWEKVFETVQVARRAHGLAPLPEGPLADMNGVQMIGLKTNALKYLIEQLPGVEKCSKYTPKYHKRSPHNAHAGSGTNALLDRKGNDITSSADYASDQDELHENPYECARSEPYSTRSEYDMFSWLASRHRKQPIQVFVQPSDTELIPRRGTGSNLPMAMKYRTLKETYKDYVGVFRSHIHGRGLYCTKDIEAGEMVIEYAGELIRSTLTDKRERNYDSRGIGCYMFKIDDNLVVDATMRGNAARFINHSCEPNCYSKVVDILGHKHIIIFALRRIVQGEELTYDYKFPFEDEKIPCSCGSKKCRKYLN